MLADVREELGHIPWYFELPSATPQEKRVRFLDPQTAPRRPDNEFALAQPTHEEAWLQFLDPRGFKAPWGIMTAERRHPQFRTRGVGGAEWDGAVWPYATSQTLVGLANVLRHYPKPYRPLALNVDYFNALQGSVVASFRAPLKTADCRDGGYRSDRRQPGRTGTPGT